MVKQFLCLRLRTAGLLIGWLGFVGFLLGSITFFCIVIESNVDTKFNIDPKSESFGINEYYNFEQKEREVMMYSTALGIFVIQALSSGMLLLGIKQNKHLMLAPWLVTTSFGILSLVILNLFGYFYVISFDSRPLYWAILNSIVVAITIYIFIAIYSLYKEIQSSKLNPPIPLMQTHPTAMPIPNTTYPNCPNYNNV